MAISIEGHFGAVDTLLLPPSPFSATGAGPLATGFAYWASQSISRALAGFGIADYTRKWSRITAAMPSAPVARLLNQPKTRPVLQVEALNVDIDGAAVQYSMTRFAGDWVQLTVSDND